MTLTLPSLEAMSVSICRESSASLSLAKVVTLVARSLNSLRSCLVKSCATVLASSAEVVFEL